MASYQVHSKEKTSGGIIDSLRCVMKVMPLMWKHAPLLSFFTLLCSLAIAFFPVLQIYLMKMIIDTTVSILNGKAPFQYGVNIIVLQLTVTIMLSFLRKIEEMLRLRMTQKISYSFDQKVIDKSARLPLVFFEKPENYNSLYRATTGIGSRAVRMYLSIVDMVSSSITLIGYLYILIQLHWILFVCVVSLLFPPVLFSIWISKKRYIQSREQTDTNRMIFYLYRLLTEKEAAKELRIFGHVKYLQDKWAGLFWKNSDEVYRLTKKTVGIDLAKEGSNQVAAAGFTLILLWFGTQGKLTIGDYVSLSQTITASVGIIQLFGLRFGDLYNETLYLKDFFTYIDLEEEKTPTHSDKNFSLLEGIRVQNLSFCYPSQEKAVLRNVSFHINPGEKIAIVGKNGAGKSTLVKCLVGLYKATKGQIFFDDQPIQDISIRSKISAIFQDFVCYNLTIQENIGIVDADSMNDIERISDAAQRAGADHFIDQLAHGYHSVLGTSFATGQDLSGGQWQKLALARALCKEQAELIILDEPTAALDPLAEAEILESFLKVTENKTAIFITHRLGSCRHVDRILVLKEGELVEEGTHEALMTANGEYAEMFRSQAQWYTKELVKA